MCLVGKARRYRCDITGREMGNNLTALSFMLVYKTVSYSTDEFFPFKRLFILSFGVNNIFNISLLRVRT